jgi:hypothetical protein
VTPEPVAQAQAPRVKHASMLRAEVAGSFEPKALASWNEGDQPSFNVGTPMLMGSGKAMSETYSAANLFKSMKG